MARAKKRKSQDYQTLKTVWYKKLEKSGFRDIEQDEYNFRHVAHSSYFSRPQSLQSWRAKEGYYTMARKFLHEYKFKSNLEKVIWEYHSEGIGHSAIAKLLKRVKIRKLNKDSVCKLTRKLALEMKRMYIPGFIPSE